MAMLVEPVHQVEHLWNVASRTRQNIGHLDIEPLQVFKELARIKPRVVVQALSRLFQSANDLVVDVGDVHHIPHVITAVLQISLENVDGDKCPEISDMDIPVDGGAASINLDSLVL